MCARVLQSVCDGKERYMTGDGYQTLIYAVVHPICLHNLNRVSFGVSQSHGLRGSASSGFIHIPVQ